MKKLFLSLLTISALSISIPTFVFAGDMSAEIANLIPSYDSATTETTLSEKIGGVIKTALSLVGVIFMILTIYAGVLWMTAAGEEERVTKATNIIKASVIGLIIVVAAYSLTFFILNAIYGGTGTSESAAAGPSTDKCCFVDNNWPMPNEYEIVASDADCQRICAQTYTSDCSLMPNMTKCPRR